MLRLRYFRWLNRISWLCAALVVLSACGGDNPSSPDSTAFDLSALIQRLRDQGATVESIRSIAQSFFSVAGQVLRVNGEEVQAFEYATETDARAEAASVSPNGFTIGTTMVSWVATPHFLPNGKRHRHLCGRQPSRTRAAPGSHGRPVRRRVVIESFGADEVGGRIRRRCAAGYEVGPR